MNKEEMIQALQLNRVAFGLMGEELQEFAKTLPTQQLLRYNGVDAFSNEDYWVSLSVEKNIGLRCLEVYRLSPDYSPDYQPIPKEVEYEICNVYPTGPIGDQVWYFKYRSGIRSLYEAPFYGCLGYGFKRLDGILWLSGPLMFRDNCDKSWIRWFDNSLKDCVPVICNYVRFRKP